MVAFIWQSQAQEKEYPVATPTDQPDVVISPYDASRRLDVEGLKPGTLAEDPIAKKIFRIPFSNPTSRYYEGYPGSSQGKVSEPTLPPVSSRTDQVIPPPPIGSEPAAPPESPRSPFDGPNAPSWAPVSNPLPTDLLNFIYAFNQNSTVNDPDALIPFYANPVLNYFGKRNVDADDIRADRASYIKRYPQREYILDGPPVLLSQNGNIYEVMMRLKYAVSGSGRIRTGAVSDYFKIKRGSRRFEILSINEAKASAAADEIQAEDIRRFETVSPIATQSGGGTVYERFEIEQISLFLDALAASGEVNEPSAMIDFMHPELTLYYDMKNPNRSDLLSDRSNYIKRWPERRYWLAEKPVITPVGPGVWDVVSKTGYEVKSGTKTANGVATSEIRLTQTSRGLKVLSIRTQK